jgi:hypothetical protein
MRQIGCFMTLRLYGLTQSPIAAAPDMCGRGSPPLAEAT